MDKLPERKKNRLENYDYSQNGAYFITICVKDRHELLGDVVGRGILDAPFVELSQNGKNFEETIAFINNKKDGIDIDIYVIMPNHVHLIVVIRDLQEGASEGIKGGASGKPRPTNAAIPKLISSMKRFVNKQAGFNIWQASYHDHIIRNEFDYLRTWQYIDENPAKWPEDIYYPGNNDTKIIQGGHDHACKN